MKLYKYKALDGEGLKHSLDMLVNEQLYLSVCDMMNDPEEGWANIDGLSKLVRNDNWQKKYQEFRAIVNSTRFTSFTTQCDNPLLWAHYAGGFRGIAFEYELDEAKYDVVSMNYTGRPTISEKQIDSIIAGNNRVHEIGVLLGKSKTWVYEDEYRLFSQVQVPGNYIYLRPTKIVMGSKESDTAKLFSSIASKFEIPISYMLPSENVIFEYDPSMD